VVSMLVVALLLLVSSSESVPITHEAAAQSYVGAVYQHTTVWGSTPAESLLKNLAEFSSVAQDAKKQGAQILVTPELGVGHSEVTRKRNAEYGEEVPEAGTMLCGAHEDVCSARPALCTAACIAKNTSLVLVIGMVDLQPCTGSGCPSDGRYVYNAAVALDEEGRILARYHKMHIFSLCPNCFDHPQTADHTTFTTSFGVEFGAFICFDLLFKDPAAELVSRGVKHFVYPTSWLNVPPVITAVQFQQAFSRMYNVTILASNNGMGREKSGSGIFSSGSVVASFFNASLSKQLDNKLLVGSVSLTPPPSAAPTHATPPAIPPPKDTIRDSHDDDLVACGVIGSSVPDCTFFHAKEGFSAQLSASHKNVTCNATIVVGDAVRGSAMQGGDVEGDGGELHAVVAFDGTAWLVEKLDLQVCAVVRCVPGPVCLPPDPALAKVYLTNPIFQTLHLHSVFSSSVHVYPVAASSGGQVLPVSDIHLQQDSQGAVDLSIAGNQTLMNAALFGRVWA